MASLAHSDDAAPMMEINTTPLIDVMLVLLIMFIVTIPIQTHSVKIDLPTPPIGPVVERGKNKVVVTQAGAVLWNGAPVTLPALEGLLARSVALDPDPELHLQPHAEAPYARVDEVLATTKRAGVELMGFVGNEQYRRF